MWAFWFPRSAAVGRNVLMIDLDRNRIAETHLPRHFESLGDVSRETLEKDGRIVGYFYWRVGYRYRG
jgi:dolichol-phosphate mannosyltransferase